MNTPDFILVFPGYFEQEMLFRYILFVRNQKPNVKEFPVQTKSLNTMALAAIMDCVYRLPERHELEIKTKSNYIKNLFDKRDYDLCKDETDKKYLFNILYNISWKSLKVDVKMLNKETYISPHGIIVENRNAPEWNDSIERDDIKFQFNV